MLLVIFVLKTFGLGLMAFGLNSALLRRSSGRLMFSFIYLVVAKSCYVCF